MIELSWSELGTLLVATPIQIGYFYCQAVIDRSIAREEYTITLWARDLADYNARQFIVLSKHTVPTGVTPEDHALILLTRLKRVLEEV